MDKAKRRESLLVAARTVFAGKGYHDAKVDDIVAAAKVAKGTFYLYFPDKRSIFVALVDSLFARLGTAILKVDPIGDVEAQVKHNIRAVIAVLLDDPALTQILLSYAAGLDPSFVSKIRSFYDVVKKLMQKALSDGQRMGIVADGDTHFFATFTIGAVKEVLFEAAVAGRSRPREQIVTELYRVVSSGYLRIGDDPRVSSDTRPRRSATGAPRRKPKS